ncbi:Hybrid signal transduction histidine kinase F [Fusarium oxysporum f. sp. albedinis]|nr:Hybrid signal transduction histidine kinase F [Fusarium oxysporum f. sp. albedinis]
MHSVSLAVLATLISQGLRLKRGHALHGLLLSSNGVLGILPRNDKSANIQHLTIQTSTLRISPSWHSSNKSVHAVIAGTCGASNQ